MQKRNYIIPIFLIMIFLLNNCDIDSNNSAVRDKGYLSIFLTDSPAAYDSVIIEFSEISAHIDSEWIILKRRPERIDLLDWSNGEIFLLAANNVPIGNLTQTRINIDTASVGINGQVYGLTIPSGSESGLKLGININIREGNTYQMILDFDATRSIVPQGSKTNPKGYILMPRIRIINQAVSGSVSGTVLNVESMPTAYAISGTDTITTTIIERTSGFFKLAFLPENSYTIIVEDTSGRDFLKDSVAVQAEKNYDLGEVILD